jgi:endoglycosylceramidase
LTSVMVNKLRPHSLIIFLLLSTFLGPALAREKREQLILNVSGERFIDGKGREVILRGVNAGGRSKLPPFYPFDPEPDFESALSRYADAIASLGFNVVRLLVIYEAAEPVRGCYNEEYLAIYDRMVAAFAARGIRVIVDSHQDLYSRRLCGDGLPDWVLPEPYRDRPTRADCQLWSLRYFTYPVARTADQLWLNQDGVRDRYVAFFQMLAKRYQDQPAVIGFEPVNEPMPGLSGLRDYSRFYGQLFDLYEAVADAVHSVDSRYLIFADLCPLENQGAWNVERAQPRINNLVLAPHYYDAGTFGLSLSPGGDKWLIRRGLKKHRELGHFWNAPVLVTEYGVSPVMQDAPAYINKLYSVFDELLLSGTFWEASMSGTIWNLENTSLFEPDGTTRPNSYHLDRPYPRAVAGVIKSFSYHPESGRFEMVWKEDPGIGMPTKVRVPERIYGAAPEVELDAPGDFRLDEKSGDLFIDALDHASTRKVIITP